MVNDLVPSVSLTSAFPSPALTSCGSAAGNEVLQFGRRYQDGWILVDRDVSAQDNAEAFYRYLRDCQAGDQRVVRAVPETPRTGRASPGRRIPAARVRIGRLRARSGAMLRYLISSQAYNYIVPLPQPWSGAYGAGSSCSCNTV